MKYAKNIRNGKKLKGNNDDLEQIGGDAMQSAIDAFEKQHSVPQIQKDRFGRYCFIPVQIGLKDCCGFVYRVFGKCKR